MKNSLVVLAMLSISTAAAADNTIGQAPATTVTNTRRPLAVTLDGIVSSKGVGAELGADLGFVGFVAGGTTTIDSTRSYVMVRAQTRGKISGYLGGGFARASEVHTPPFRFGGHSGEPDPPTYTDRAIYTTFEVGFRQQWDVVTIRAFVGGDIEMSADCKMGDCYRAPVFAGFAVGAAFH